ncbi:MAG: S8 family serine peptidase, partial [Bacteroidales bacterium]
QLIRIAEKQASIYKISQAEALQKAKEKGFVIYYEDPNGSTIALQSLRNGMPVYYITDNLNAAKTISTNQLWSGGTAGLNLSGSGQVLGEWDANAVRPTHQELTGRVTQVDGETVQNAHSTHVAGTLIAQGTVASAKGMSPAASLHAYDWDNDESEMALAAAAGLKISNHSYGSIAGWYSYSGYWYWYGWIPYSETEDFGFGYYDDQAALWDQIAHDAPAYLIVKAAGNDRGEGPSSGAGHYAWIDGAWTWSTTVRDKDGGALGYDCISYNGTAKNIMTVGAVNDITSGYTQVSDVVMTSFSGWGPTDDGRIKPDIVANGYGLYSSLETSNTAYGTYNGTSMASPNVAGSLGLLLQHKENLDGNSEIWKAATMKALVLHTADEAGTNPGPDYIFGWGLMNTKTAALLMTSDHTEGANFNIRELSLSNGGTYQTTVYADGTNPLKATIVWSDPAGTPATPSNDPTDLMLVNDLDMRLTDPVSTVYYPYILNPASPASAASTGDNYRDNVEQVYITGTTYGKAYTLTINHKGSLTGGSQDFSLILTGITPNPTYVWTRATDNSWTTATNWSPARNNPGSADSLVFNNGGTYTITSVPAETTGQLTITSSTKITLQAAAPSNTLTIQGGNGTDILVNSGSELNISGTNDLLLHLNTSTTALISGNMTFSGAAHRFTAADAGAIVFGSGSVFNASTAFTGSAFGTSAPYNAVIFSSGSSYLHGAGSDPFGATQPNSLVQFQTGSLYKLTSNIDPSFDGRTYSNFELDASGSNVSGIGSVAATLDNLTITNGTFNCNLTGSPGHTIKGNISVAATATLNFKPASSGTLSFDGTSVQTISGGGTISANSNATFVINNTLITDNHLNISGSLTINSGKSLTVNAGKQVTIGMNLTNNAGINGLLLQSDAGGTASLIHNSSGVQASIQRYISEDNWHYFSSPVSSATAGIFNPNDYLLIWDEATATWSYETYLTALNPVQGYGLWSINPNTYTFTGALNTGNLSKAITFTNLPESSYDGANLLGNPYPSSIDWDGLRSTYGAVYYWNGTAYDSWNNGGSGSQFIPPMQGFFIIINADGNFALTNSNRIHSTTAYYKSAEELADPSIVLEANSMSYSDKLYIRLDESAISEFEMQKDAYKFMSTTTGLSQLFSVSGESKLSIDVRPACDIIQLGFVNDKSGTYQIGISEINGIDIALLEDTKTAYKHDLLLGNYTFNWESNDDIKRFKLLFNAVGVEENEISGLSVYASGQTIFIGSQNSNQKLDINVIDMMGRIVLSKQIESAGITTIATSLKAGVYVVNIRDGNKLVNEKVMIH